jgi:hypothetical protein
MKILKQNEYLTVRIIIRIVWVFKTFLDTSQFASRPTPSSLSSGTSNKIHSYYNYLLKIYLIPNDLCVH